MGTHNKKVRRNWGSRTSHLWPSRQSRSAEAELQTFGSPGRDEKCGREIIHIWKSWPTGSPGRAELQIFGSKDRAELRKQSLRPLKVPAERKCGSWASYSWQLRQSRSSEAELHIFGSHGRDEMRKWTYPYLEVLVEKVWKMNEICLSPGREEVRKAELQVFGSQGRAEVRKRNHIFGSPGRDEMRKWTYPYLEVLAEQVRKMNETFRSPGQAKVRKAELKVFGSKDRAEMRKRNFRPLKVLAELKCRSWTSDRWQPRQDGSEEANFTSYEELAVQKCGTEFMSHYW